MNPRLYIFLCCLMSFWITIVHAQEDSTQKTHKVTLKGYVKYMEQASFGGEPTQILTDGLIHNRLNLRFHPDNFWNFRLEVRNRIYYGDLVQNYPGFATLVTPSYGSVNLSKNWVSKNAVLANSSIDRLSGEWTKGKWDITMGRQRINWGINTVWTPNDIFNTFNYFDFDYEERPGSDAARVQYTLGSASSLELAASPGKTDSLHIGALMYHLNKWNFDFQGFAGVYHRDLATGAGWAGNIRGAGFKGEITWFTPYGHHLDTASLLASLSLDYGFRNGIYVLISGLYNSLGGDTILQIAQLQSATLSAKNSFPFKYTGFAEISYSFTPILKTTFAAMYSPSGHSLIVLPTITYSIANNWVLDLVGQSFFSKQNNSYQSLGTSLYLRLKWGF